MKAYWNVIQGTEEWHRLRYGKIGGSTSKGLLTDTDTLLDDLLSTRLEPFELEEDGYASPEMQRGNELEPLARLNLSMYTGIQFKECGWLQSVELPLLGISPDGLTEDLKIACEIKCPSRKKHTNTLRNGVIPLDHLHQIVHNFTVNPFLEIIYFASFRPESVHPLFVRHADKNTIINLGTKAKPILKPISEWVDIIKGKTIELHNKIDQVEKDLSF
jgi:hypothetical protein